MYLFIHSLFGNTRWHASSATKDYLPHRIIAYLRSHKSLQSANEPQRRDQTQACLLPHRPKCHTGLITTTKDYYSTGLFCHRFIHHIGLLYALLPHRSTCISLKDTRVKRKSIACLICHKGLPSTQDHCMLYSHTGLYKALTSHQGENKPEHNRNYSQP